MNLWSIPRVVILSVLLVGLLLLAACKSKPVEYPAETREVFGTQVTIRLYAEDQLVDSIQRIFDQVFATLSHWEQMTLSSGDLNQVANISKGAGTQSIIVDSEVFEMIMAATRLHDQSGHLFDIRMGPLYDAWGFDTTPAVPDSAKLAEALALVNEGGMYVAGKSILLAKPGMRLDVRNIVQGYAFDQAANQLMELGFQNFTISSPTVFLAVGTSPDQKGFELNLHHPVIADSILTTVYVQSGGYAYLTPRIGYFEQDGVAYNSLLNPATGMPSTTYSALLVNAPNAAAAEALAAAMFVQNEGQEIPQEGLDLIKGSVKFTASGNSFQIDKTGSFAGFELSH